jgi:hypothetical protein
MSLEQSVKCLAEETEVLGENLPSAALSITNSNGLGPGPLLWELGLIA